MSTLTAIDINKVAALAKLIISDNARASLEKDLSKILGFIDKMNEADIDSVEAAAHAYNKTQPFRDDVVTELNQRSLLQKSAPQIENGLYIVPVVIENEE